MRILPAAVFLCFLSPVAPVLTTEAAPAPPTPAKVDYLNILPKALKPAIFVINNGVGTGTGFVGRLHGKIFLITNLHMIFSAKDIVATNQDGIKLELGDIYGALDHDVAIIGIKNAVPPVALDIVESDLPDAAAVNDAILIPGNSLGGSTLLQTGGKVVGLGPRVIEHDAPVFQGNSGSPILAQKDWKVIGVMAYSRKVDANGRWIKDALLNKDAQIKGTTRFFGFRLDTVKTWYPIDLTTWRQQCAFLEEKKKRIYAVLSFYSGNRKRWLADAEISSRLAGCNAKMAKLNSGNARRDEAAGFLGFLRTRLESDTNSLTAFESTCYPFLKDGENNFGDCTVRLKSYGDEVDAIIKSRNDEIVAKIVGRNGR